MDEPDFDIDAMLAEEEEMDQAYADQEEFDQYGVDNDMTVDDDVTKELKEQDAAQARHVANPKTTSTTRGYGPGEGGHDTSDNGMDADAEEATATAYTSTAAARRALKMLPAEIAMALQHNRQASGIGANTTSSQQHNMLNVTVLSTQSERVTRISQSVASQFLHTRPVGSGALTSGLSNTIAGANADSILYAKAKLGTPVGDDGGAEVEAGAGAGAGLASGGGYGPGTGAVGTDTAHLTTVLANGDRLFLRSRKSSEGSSSGSGSGSDGHGELSGDLLGQPMTALMEEARKVQVRCAAQRAHREATAAAAAAATASSDNFDEGTAAFVSQTQAQQKQGAMGDKELWVSKHAPHNFSQLLSSERINRDVLRAVKQWDPYVFKRATSSQSVTATNTAAAKAAAGGDDKSKNGNSSYHNQNNKAAADAADAVGDGSSKNNNADTRPEYKVILLSGPPGTGKTTLAHIIAKHCGYRPMEINASDDRSAEVLRGHVERACVGNTVTGDKRPNCLILDEIDGIDNRGSIDALTAIIRQPLKKKKGKGGGGSGGSGSNDNDGDDADDSTTRTASSSSGNKSKIALTRPIIAICNDQFAPVLRDLRKYAQIFTFNAPQEKRLVMRLKAIAVQEKLQVSLDALQTLATASIGDVRSSINTLQFASLRASAQNSTMSATGDAVDSGTDHDSWLSRGRKENISDVLTSLISSGLKDQVRHSFLSFPFLSFPFCVCIFIFSNPPLTPLFLLPHTHTHTLSLSLSLSLLPTGQRCISGMERNFLTSGGGCDSCC